MMEYISSCVRHTSVKLNDKLIVVEAQLHSVVGIFPAKPQQIFLHVGIFRSLIDDNTRLEYKCYITQ